MGRFLKNILIWGAIILALATILDVMVSAGLRRSGIRKYVVWSDIFNHRIDADLIIIGSSRAWCGYNTYLLDSLLGCNSYNLGIDGHQLDMQLIRYETYRRFNPPPKTILINTDFCSTMGITADERYEREQFFPFIHDRVLIRQVARAKHLTFGERLFPFIRYFGYREELDNGISAFFGKTDFSDGGFHKGYRGNDYPWDEGTTLHSITPVSITIDTVITGQLNSFISDATAEGIQVFMVKSPVFAPLLDKFDNIAVSDSIFSKIADNNSVPLLDYYYADFCYDTSFFYNPSHLNKKGACIFTDDLCHALIQHNIHYFECNKDK